MKKLLIGLSVLASTQLFAFDFSNFDGKYELQDLGESNQECPLLMNILRENSKFYAYSLDEEKDVFVPTIEFKNMNRGVIFKDSPGVKSEINTYVSERDPSYIIMSEKGRRYMNQNNTIPVPFSKFENYYTFQQGDNTNKLVYSQSGDHEKMICYYIKLGF